MLIGSRLAKSLIVVAAFTVAAQPAAAADPAEVRPAVRPAAASIAGKNGTRPVALDLDGRPTNPFVDAKAKVLVLIFVSTDCPVANRYAPDIERLYEKYGAKRVAFWLVYADSRDSVDKIRTHLREYQYKVSALRDPEHRLVRRCRVTKTPEAAVFAADGKEAYRGRIDDRFTDYGKLRNAPSRRDVQEAIDALCGRPVKVATTDVVGCFIPDVDP